MLGMLVTIHETMVVYTGESQKHAIINWTLKPSICHAALSQLKVVQRTIKPNLMSHGLQWIGHSLGEVIFCNTREFTIDIIYDLNS